MKALIYTGEKSLAYEDAPDPDESADTVRVRVESVGICGSDMHAFLGHDERRPAPLILGHEAAGVVLDGRMAGQRVTINPLVTCGTCPACLAGRDNLCPSRQIISMPPREGAFAEMVAIPERNLVVVPDHVPSDHAALVEPLACGWHAVRLAQPILALPPGEISALVLGGGAIGVGAALALAAHGIGAIKVAEPNPVRRARLDSLAGFAVVDPASTGAVSAGAADLVIDAAGFAATRRAASRAVRHGGVIAHIGLGDNDGGLDVRRMTLQEITFFGTYTYTRGDFADTAAALFSGRLGGLDWVETRPLAVGAAAFDDILAGRVAAPKIVLNP